MKKIYIVLLAAVTAFVIRYIWLLLCPYALLDLDIGTVGLMARHILKGHFPMFFYGQSYLAPVESYIAALFFMIFGCSHIVLQLVPVVLTLVCGILVYYLGKAIKDEAAGLWSALMFLFPPVAFFLKGFKSQGYISEYLLCGVLILLLCLKIVECANDKSYRTKVIIYYALLGIVSAIGFWIVYSTIQFMVIAGVFLLFHFRRSRLFSYGFIWPVSFFLSGLPYWIYSYNDNWGTFYFGKVTRYDIKAVIAKFFVVDMRKLLTAGLNNPMTILVLAVYIAVFVFFVVYSLKIRRNKMWLVWLLPVLIFIFYLNPSLYRFAIKADTRYIIGIYLSLALAAGFAASWLNEKKKYLGTLLIFFLVGINLYTSMGSVARYRQQSEENKNRHDRIVSLLKENNLNKVLLRGREFRELGFLTNEEIVFTEYHGGGYPGYHQVFEGDSDIAYYMLNCDSSLAGVCAGFEKVDNFYFGFQRYPYRNREIIPRNWVVASNYNSDECSLAVDRDFSTLWTSAVPMKQDMYFSVDLGKEYPVSKIQVFYADRYYSLPEKIRVYLSNDGASWREVLAVAGVESFFWSGPRLYYLVVNGRYELNFQPQNARYIKISQEGGNSPHAWDITELFIYEHIGEDLSGWDEKQLRKADDFMRSKGIDFIYADFWESAKLKEWGGVGTVNVFDKSNDKRYVSLSGKTGFIINESNREGWDMILKELNVNLANKGFGSYWCYFLDGVSEEDEQFYQKLTSIYWLGITGVKIDLYRYSDLLYETGLLSEEKNECKKAEGFYRQALEVYPRYMPYEKLKGMGVDVTSWRQYFEPENVKKVVFRNGFFFLE